MRAADGALARSRASSIRPSQVPGSPAVEPAPSTRGPAGIAVVPVSGWPAVAVVPTIAPAQLAAVALPAMNSCGSSPERQTACSASTSADWAAAALSSRATPAVVARLQVKTLLAPPRAPLPSWRTIRP